MAMCACPWASSISTTSSRTSSRALKRLPGGRSELPDRIWNRDMSIASIQVGGINVRYFAVGAGEPIVLLHCTGGSGRQWTGLAETLREEFQIIDPDHSGYGATTQWPWHRHFNCGGQAHSFRRAIL